MRYMKDLPNRKSIRLQGWDYSGPGMYFITIGTWHQKHLFGKIINGKMQLSKCGGIIDKWWHRISDKYERVYLDAFIIMPNHIHGIIELKDSFCTGDS